MNPHLSPHNKEVICGVVSDPKRIFLPSDKSQFVCPEFLEKLLWLDYIMCVCMHDAPYFTVRRRTRQLGDYVTPNEYFPINCVLWWPFIIRVNTNSELKVGFVIQTRSELGCWAVHLLNIT